jgi:hypothetical protein
VQYICLAAPAATPHPPLLSLVARGSWLVARGSWLVARGSWLVFGILYFVADPYAAVYALIVAFPFRAI